MNQNAYRNDVDRQKQQSELDMYTTKYEVSLKEKMLMKLEKDRLTAKVDNLELTIKQNDDETS